MSDVQLSLSLERLAARRTFPLQRRTSVCRSLFGPVDHDELRREMHSKLREISERDTERWNFDFEAESPLDGLYEWQEVSAHETPSFYHKDSLRVPATPVKRRDGESVMERLSAPPEAPGLSPAAGAAEVNQENRRDRVNSRRTRRVQPGSKRRRTDTLDNTHITDFFVKRKRVGADLSSKSPVIPAEQTPRKRIR